MKFCKPLIVCVCWLLLLFYGKISAENTSSLLPTSNPVYHVAPPHWYVGFEDTTLEVILHAENIDMYELTMDSFAGVRFHGKAMTANRHVAYLRFTIQPGAKPGVLQFSAKPVVRRARYTKPFKFTYELKERQSKVKPPQAVTSADLMYLILPDRFVNGDPRNDKAQVKLPDAVDRTLPKSRHGGDLKGIESKLGYLQDLGITALWLNPVQENDQPTESYHGYAITDHYRIDPRLGSNEDYLRLCKLASDKGIKMVMDIIPNHFGRHHWLFQNFDTGWFNSRDSFFRTNYRAHTINDPYAAPSERSKNLDGWFDVNMPDVNQNNVHMRRYLDQMYLWWVEYAQLNGYRIDTYPYPDQGYMNHLVALLKSEFPYLTIFGETWVTGMGTQAGFVQNNIKGFEHVQLPSVTDFQLAWAMQEALTKPFGWTDGLNKVYQILSEDFLYKNPMQLCTFLDNHDLSRIYSIVGEDIRKWRMGITLLLTLRGMPCIYYGTEILMAGTTAETDANVRKDFPGGWKEDSENKFLEEFRTPIENEAHDYLRKLAAFRKQSKALQMGQTTQYAGENGTYVYFRTYEKETVMVAYNQEQNSRTLDMSRFAYNLKGFTRARNAITGQEMELTQALTLGAFSATVLVLLP